MDASATFVSSVGDLSPSPDTAGTSGGALVGSLSVFSATSGSATANVEAAGRRGDAEEGTSPYSPSSNNLGVGNGLVVNTEVAPGVVALGKGK